MRGAMRQEKPNNTKKVTLSSSKHRTALHLRIRWNPEFLEDRDGEIRQIGIGQANRPVGQQHTRDAARIDAVVADPEVAILFQDALRRRTQGGLPGSAETGGVSDNQVGS